MRATRLVSLCDGWWRTLPATDDGPRGRDRRCARLLPSRLPILAPSLPFLPPEAPPLRRGADRAPAPAFPRHGAGARLLRRRDVRGPVRRRSSRRDLRDLWRAASRGGAAPRSRARAGHDLRPVAAARDGRARGGGAQPERLAAVLERNRDSRAPRARAARQERERAQA